MKLYQIERKDTDSCGFPTYVLTTILFSTEEKAQTYCDKHNEKGLYDWNDDGYYDWINVFVDEEED